jgi:hypothetical protein
MRQIRTSTTADRRRSVIARPAECRPSRGGRSMFAASARAQRAGALRPDDVERPRTAQSRPARSSSPRPRRTESSLPAKPGSGLVAAASGSAARIVFAPRRVSSATARILNWVRGWSLRQRPWSPPGVSCSAARTPSRRARRDRRRRRPPRLRRALRHRATRSTNPCALRAVVAAWTLSRRSMQAECAQQHRCEARASERPSEDRQCLPFVEHENLPRERRSRGGIATKLPKRKCEHSTQRRERRRA